MRYSIIGCGRIAPNHIAAALANAGNIEVAALCDPIEENRRKILQQIPPDLRRDVREYDDYHTMLQDVKPELCAIAAESGKHAQIALDCIDAGVHVIIEKPIALSLSDADEIIRRSKEKNVKVCACHQNRFNKSIQKIRSAVEEGRFGRLLHGTAHIRWSRDENYYKQAPWRGTWEQDGGALMNQCIHNIDLLRWMMGDDIIEVIAYTDCLMHPYLETEDLGLAMVRFANGSYGLIEGTTNVFPCNLEETLYLFGEKGTVKTGGKSVNIIEEWRFCENEDAEEIKTRFSEEPPNIYGFGHTPLYTDMVDAIKNDRKPYVDAKAGRAALELVLAIYQSAKEGRSISLPLTEFSTLDMVDYTFHARR